MKQTIRKIYVFLMLVIAVSILKPNNAFAATAKTSVSANGGKVGDTIAVNIEISSDDILGTYEIYIDYNEIIPDSISPTNNIEDNRKYIEQVYVSREVNEIKFSDKEVSLFTFFLQLVSYLKFIGTVPAIDINAYLKAIHVKIDEDI